MVGHRSQAGMVKRDTMLSLGRQQRRVARRRTTREHRTSSLTPAFLTVVGVEGARKILCMVVVLRQRWVVSVWDIRQGCRRLEETPVDSQVHYL